MGVNVQDGEILRAKDLAWQSTVGRNLLNSRSKRAST